MKEENIKQRLVYIMVTQVTATDSYLQEVYWDHITKKTYKIFLSLKTVECLEWTQKQTELNCFLQKEIQMKILTITDD